MTIDRAVEVKIFMPFALDKLDILIFLLLRCKSMDWFPHQIKIINFFTNFIYLNIIYSLFLFIRFEHYNRGILYWHLPLYCSTPENFVIRDDQVKEFNFMITCIWNLSESFLINHFSKFCYFTEKGFVMKGQANLRQSNSLRNWLNYRLPVQELVRNI